MTDDKDRGELRSWLDGKGFLLDIYGVAYNCGENFALIEGSKQAINLLVKHKIPFRFCSNTSSRSPNQVHQDMKKFGFDVKVDQIFTPIPVVKSYIIQNKLRPFLLVNPEIDDYFDDLDTSDPNVVVIGDCKHRFSYENLNKAFNILLKDPKAPLLTLGTGKYYKETEGILLDCGPFAQLLHYATGREVKCIGKPDKDYFLSVVHSMNLQPSQCIMVGDDIEGDIEGAQKAGLHGIQVRTGKYRPSYEPHERIKPSAYVENLLEAIHLYINHHFK